MLVAPAPPSEAAVRFPEVHRLRQRQRQAGRLPDGLLPPQLGLAEPEELHDVHKVGLTRLREGVHALVVRRTQQILRTFGYSLRRAADVVVLRDIVRDGGAGSDAQKGGLLV
jgi:hypothetical protein